MPIRLSRRWSHSDVERSGEIRLANRGTHAKLLLALRDVDVQAPDGRKLFRIAKLHVFQSDRVVLLGRNGVGKSQFVQLLRRGLAGNDVPGLRTSPSIVTGYVDQLMSHLPETATPHGFISSTFRPGDQRATSLLASAGFTVEMQRRRIATLSPGQKARLGLLALRLTEPNFYLMDEPTNHVDIAGQERLEEEIMAHEATGMIVSHDRAFVQSIGTRFLLIDSGTIAEIDSADAFYRSLGKHVT